MLKEYFYPTHNTLTFSARKIKPIFAKHVNDVMYQVTELDGAYKYENRDENTIFTIYPESFEFGDDPSEITTHLDTYIEIYKYVVSQHPESLQI